MEQYELRMSNRKHCSYKIFHWNDKLNTCLVSLFASLEKLNVFSMLNVNVFYQTIYNVLLRRQQKKDKKKNETE